MLTRPDGTSLAYSKIGTGTPLIVVNGLLQTKESWDNFAQHFDQHGVAVVTYNLRNQGISPTLSVTQETIDTHVDDLAALMDHMSCETAPIMGYSYGSEIAQAFAARFPKKTEKLILTAAHCPILAGRYAMIFRSWLRSLPEVQSDDWVSFARTVCPWIFGASYMLDKASFPEKYASYVSTTQSRDGLGKNLHILIAAFEEKAALNETSEKIETPSLFINGEDDYITPPIYLSQSLKRFPHATAQTIKGCGHAVRAETPDLFARSVLDFILGE